MEEESRPYMEAKAAEAEIKKAFLLTATVFKNSSITGSALKKNKWHTDFRKPILRVSPHFFVELRWEEITGPSSGTGSVP